MFQLVTLNPAKAVQMDDDIGSIKEGKKADIIIIEKMDDGFPMVTDINRRWKTNYKDGVPCR